MGLPKRIFVLIALVGLLIVPASAAAKQRVHVVAKGHTLGKISKRYHVSIAALCEANHIRRRDPLKVGQKIVIPDTDSGHSKDHDDAKADHDDAKADHGDAKTGHDDARADQDEAKANKKPKATRPFGSDGMRELHVPGHAPAYYYFPTGPGRKGLRPVVMYLHGRGGSPIRDCRRWAKVARRFGWVVCPSGSSPHGAGRDWDNNWPAGHNIVMATLAALRKAYGRRVQLYGNTLVGFSEGAYVAMNVGVREPHAFNRWLILAGNTSYWGGAGYEELKKNARRLRRVYLITGEQDSVINGTRQLEDWLAKAHVATRTSTPRDMGHEIALERKPAMYRAALHWLDRGTGAPARSRRARRFKRKNTRSRR